MSIPTNEPVGPSALLDSAGIRENLYVWRTSYSTGPRLYKAAQPSSVTNRPALPGTEQRLQQQATGRLAWSSHLVAVVLDEVKHKATVHERQKVIEEESQADVDLLRLFIFLQKQTQKRSQRLAVNHAQELQDSKIGGKL